MALTNQDESPHIVGYLDSAESADAVLRRLRSERLPFLQVEIVQVSANESDGGEFNEATLYWASRGALLGALMATLLLLPVLVVPEEGAVPGWPWLILIAWGEGALVGACLSALTAGVGIVIRKIVRHLANGNHGRRRALALYARGNDGAVRHVGEVLREFGASRIDEFR